MESLQERNITSAISESVFKTWMYWNGSFQLWKIVNEIYFSLEGGFKKNECRSNVISIDIYRWILCLEMY